MFESESVETVSQLSPYRATNDTPSNSPIALVNDNKDHSDMNVPSNGGHCESLVSVSETVHFEPGNLCLYGAGTPLQSNHVHGNSNGFHNVDFVASVKHELDVMPLTKPVTEIVESCSESTDLDERTGPSAIQIECSSEHKPCTSIIVINVRECHVCSEQVPYSDWYRHFTHHNQKPVSSKPEGQINNKECYICHERVPFSDWFWHFRSHCDIGNNGKNAKLWKSSSVSYESTESTESSYDSNQVCEAGASSAVMEICERIEEDDKKILEGNGQAFITPVCGGMSAKMEQVSKSADSCSLVTPKRGRRKSSEVDSKHCNGLSSATQNAEGVKRKPKNKASKKAGIDSSIKFFSDLENLEKKFKKGTNLETVNNTPKSSTSLGPVVDSTLEKTPPIRNHTERKNEKIGADTKVAALISAANLTFGTNKVKSEEEVAPMFDTTPCKSGQWRASADCVAFCDPCQLEFDTLKESFMHNNQHHANNNPFMCNLCNKTLSRKEHVKRHKSNVHKNLGYGSSSNQQELACKVCNANFHSPWSRKRHEGRCGNKNLSPTSVVNESAENSTDEDDSDMSLAQIASMNLLSDQKSSEKKTKKVSTGGVTTEEEGSPKKKASESKKKPTTVKIAAPGKKKTPKKEGKSPKTPKSDSKRKASAVSDSEDEPLVKKSKKEPNDDEVRALVKNILKNADLEQVTMKTVCKQVYDNYPDVDMTPRKDFIKDTVKEIIS